jgi:hypothetical protein
MKLKFEITDTELRHTCLGRQEGEWVVFTCPECKGFERRINFHTGKMTTRQGENPEVLHVGDFQPAEWDMDSRQN